MREKRPGNHCQLLNICQLFCEDSCTRANLHIWLEPGPFDPKCSAITSKGIYQFYLRHATIPLKKEERLRDKQKERCFFILINCLLENVLIQLREFMVILKRTKNKKKTQYLRTYSETTFVKSSVSLVKKFPLWSSAMSNGINSKNLNEGGGTGLSISLVLLF